MIRDPFQGDQSKESAAICLGSKCSLCQRPVCVGAKCSLFYTRRFCMPCLRSNLSSLPPEIKKQMPPLHDQKSDEPQSG